MKTALSVGLLIGILSVPGWSQTSTTELTCRSKAKEVAAQAYSGCVAEARNNQVDEVRRNYERDLQDLKNKYDQELKRLGAPVSQGGASGGSAAGSSSVGEGAVPRAAITSTGKGGQKTSPTAAARTAKIASKKSKASSRSLALPAKALAQKLPTKRTSTGDAPWIHQSAPVSESQVIAVGPGPESTSQSVEPEPTRADQFEIVEMPAIEE